MQSYQDFSGGAQADYMFQVILNKFNEQKSDMERTMAMQLDQLKEELRGATSSLKSWKVIKVPFGRTQVIRINMNIMKKFLIPWLKLYGH